MTTERFRFPDTGTDLIGAHLSTRGGLDTVFERRRATDSSAVAIFSKNSSQWAAKDLTEKFCEQFRAQSAAAGSPPLLIHASYLINLAATDPIVHEKSIAAMIVELQRAERLGAYALVLHPGAHIRAGVNAGIDRVCRSLDRIHAAIPQCRTITLLEAAAGQGSCLGCSFEELGAMINGVDERSRLGICIDTCHIFSAGYEIRTRDGYARTMEEMEKHVGLHNVGAFHLNDSKRPLGARVDRHQHIGDGEIGLEPFGFLLNDPRFTGIPKVIETPKPDPFDADIRNLSRLRSLLAAESCNSPRAIRRRPPAGRRTPAKRRVSSSATERVSSAR